MKTKHSYIVYISILYALFIASCANIGQPTGGDKDTIPPQIVEIKPSIREKNFKGDEFKVTFNEFVTMSELRQKMVISPPPKEQPEVKTRGKSFTIQFKDTLLQNTTYTLDFKDAIADNNEGNKMYNFRTSFSTGSTIDTLRIAGMVRDAYTLKPMKEVSVFIYKDLSDSASIKKRPDYIARTNEEGVFIVDGLAAKTYRIYAVSDLNRDYQLNNYSEPYAFYPTTITPSASFIAEKDTIVKGLDTLLVSGTIQYFPDPILLSQFQEKVLLQSMNDYKRIDSTHFYIAFTEAIDKNFRIEAINIDAPLEQWLYKESNEKNDSINYWITDPKVYQNDTLLLAVTYTVPDSLYQPKIQTDTLELLTPKKKEIKKKRGRRKLKDNEEKVPSFKWETNAKSSVNPYDYIFIQSKEPIEALDKSYIHLTEKVDTLDIPVDFKLVRDSLNRRKFFIDFKLDPGKNYDLKVDSAATQNIYKENSEELGAKITVRKDDYYGKIILSIANVKGPTLIQLLKNNKKETVTNEIRVDKDGEIEFFYVKPGKYLIKAIFDQNDNGKWDTGNLLNQTQPEGIVYYQEVINIRSNWDNEKFWDLPLPLKFTKDIKDPDDPEKDVKKDNF